MRNLLIISGLFLLAGNIKAQDIYANADTTSTTAVTCTSCGVTNPGNAVDANLSNFATMGVRVATTGGQVQQTYQFPVSGNAGDTVVFSLEIPYSPSVTDANTLIFNSFNGATANGEAYTTQFKAVAPTGGGSFQFVFMPTAAYDRVQMILNAGSIIPLLAPADSINIYSVRILRSGVVPSTPAPIAGCEDPIAEVDSISAMCLGFCGVENPGNILTSDPTDFTTLRISTLLSGTYAAITGYYGSTACSTDTVVIAFENAAGTLTPASYANITINAVLDSVIVGTTGGTLNTFPPASITTVGNIVYLTFVPGAAFNGISVINMAGNTPANNVQQLRLYQFCLRRLSPPVPVTGRTANICYNTSYTFSTISPAGTTTYYYDAPTGGNLLDSGATYTTGNLTDTTIIYFETYNQTSGCVSSLRDSVVINVYPQVLPLGPQDTVSACYLDKAIITPQPYGGLYNFYTDAAMTNLVGSGQFYVLDTIYGDTVIYVENTYLGLCNGGAVTPAFVQRIVEPYLADIADSTTYCLGSVQTLSINQPVPGITYRWYRADRTLVNTGNTYPNFTVNAHDSLYIETTFACPSRPENERTRIDIFGVDQSTLTVSIASPIYVCDDDTAVALATTTSADPNVVFEWFDASITQVFTGNPFLIRAPVDSAIFTVQTRVGQCASSTRATYQLYNLNTITDQSFDTLIAVCAGDTATITSNIKVPGATYSWYDASFTFIQTSDSLVVPPSNNILIYYFTISNVSCLNNSQFHKIQIDRVAFPPTAAVDTNLVYFCGNSQVTITGNATPTPAVLTWWDAPTNGTQVAAGDTFRFTTASDTTIIYAQAEIDQCFSDGREPVLVVKADNIMQVTSLNDTICDGSSARLFASSQINGGDFSWYNAATGGTRLATGNPFNTPILTSTTTYYVEVEFNDPNVCPVRPRTAVTVEVLRILNAPIVSCGTSTNTSITFNWLDDAAAVRFEISLDGGVSFMPPNNGRTSHMLTGLQPDSSVTAIVRAIGPRACQNSAYSNAVTCVATDCTPVNARLDQAFYEICDDETTRITILNLPAGYEIRYYDSTGSVNTTRTANFFDFRDTTPGTYKLPFDIYVVGENQCDTQHLEATVIVHDSPDARIDVVALTPAVAGAFISQFQFVSNTDGGNQWSWNFGDGTGSTEQNPAHQYAQEGSYQVTLYVVNQFGCDDSDTLDRLVKVSRVPDIYIPNTFTPNADKKNDTFRVYGQNIRLEKMRIFNTYGNMVFETNELARGWDGTYNGDPAPSGTYYYTAVVRDELNIAYEREGSITLIRK